MSSDAHVPFVGFHKGLLSLIKFITASGGSNETVVTGVLFLKIPDATIGFSFTNTSVFITTTFTFLGEWITFDVQEVKTLFFSTTGLPFLIT